MLSRLWTRVSPGRTLSGGVAAVVVVPLALVLARADGLPGVRAELSGGGAWLASPTQGTVTLIDGASEQVVGAVRAPGFRRGDDVAAVQAGSSAYLVSSAAGTVSRVDGGTYEVSAPVRFGEGGHGGALQVQAGGPATYVVDGQRRTASLVDPVSLRVRQRLALAAQPGPGQSVVDDDGRLWVVDANGLAWFDAAGKHVRPDGGGAGMRLVLVAGRPVLVDLARARAGRLAAGGTVRAWSCLDLRGGERVELLGSGTLGRVLAAIPATGTLVAAGDGGEDCGQALDVGRPGDDFGPLVESGGFVFVPNRTSGRTAVVDLSARQVVANLDLVKAGARLELVAKDGLVFYNDLDGDQAGVIRLEGGRWRVGKALRKYSPGRNGTKILTPGGDRHPRQPPAQPPGQQHRPDSDPNPPGATPPAGNPPGGGPTPPAGVPPGGPLDGPAPPGGGPPGGGPSTGPTAPVAAVLVVQVVGAGSVTASQPAPLNAPAGTQCGATCTWQYPTGTAAVLQVPNAPTPDLRLASVDGCTGRDIGTDGIVCTVLVIGTVTVTATFVPAPPKQVTLTVTAIGSGTVTATPSGGSPTACAPTCSVTVVAGTPIDLAATASAGSYLSDWTSAGCAPTEPTCALPAADTAVTVVFAPFLDLTVRTAGTGAGSVAGPGLTCGATCHGRYRSGDVVPLSASAGARSSFDGWAGCAPPSATTCAVTMTADTTVTATFTLLPDTTAPTLTVTGDGQTATLDAGAEVQRGGSDTTITIVVTATDPESPVTHIELENDFQDDCSDGHVTRRDPARFDGATSSSGTLTYVLDMPAVACDSESPELVQAGFAITVRATSEGGTSAFTKAFIVRYRE